MGNRGVHNVFFGDNKGPVVQSGDVHLNVAWSEANQARMRITAAFTQLFDDSPVLQVGALDELEGIGCKFPALRQAVVDLLCGFLPERSRTDSWRVCEKAQETLSRRLSGHDVHQGRCSRDELELWENIRVDLRGAFLQDFSFMDAELDQADFAGAEFHGRTQMSGMRIWGYARFDGAVFHGPAFLDKTCFERGATFTGGDYSGGSVRAQTVSGIQHSPSANRTRASNMPIPCLAAVAT